MYEPHTTVANLLIPENLLTDLKNYVHGVRVEVGGFLIGRCLGEGNYQADSIVLPKQVVHGTEVDVEPIATAKVLESLAVEFSNEFTESIAKFPEGTKATTIGNRYNKLFATRRTIIAQWHSHVNMSVFTSGGDEKTLKSMSEDFGTMIMMIMNRDDIACAWLSATDSVLLHKAPVSIAVAEANGEPLSIEAIVNNVKENVFHADNMCVETKGAKKGHLVTAEEHYVNN